MQVGAEPGQRAHVRQPRCTPPRTGGDRSLQGSLRPGDRGAKPGGRPGGRGRLPGPVGRRTRHPGDAPDDGAQPHRLRLRQSGPRDRI